MIHGLKIGSRVIVGVGSVVSKDISENGMAASIHVRAIKTIDEYFEQMRNKSLKRARLKGLEKEAF